MVEQIPCIEETFKAYPAFPYNWRMRFELELVEGTESRRPVIDKLTRLIRESDNPEKEFGVSIENDIVDLYKLEDKFYSIFGKTIPGYESTWRHP